MRFGGNASNPYVGAKTKPVVKETPKELQKETIKKEEKKNENKSWKNCRILYDEKSC